MLSDMLKAAIPMLSLGIGNSDIEYLVDYLKTISNNDLDELRDKVAKSRQRAMLLTDMKWFVRSEAFAAIRAECKRRIEEGVYINVTQPATIRFRRHVPVSR